MSKKLSIAIPTHNRLGYLKDCINSILNQTFQDFSIFVFDNASDEPVEKELAKFNDERIHFIGSDKNIGSAGNINRILGYPFKSKYLIIFHDDDLMHPKMLETETSFLDDKDDIIFVASDFNRFFDENINNFENFSDKETKYVIYKNNYEFVKGIILWLSYAFSSIMYRVNCIGDTRMEFDKFSYFADMMFVLEFSKKGPCAFIDLPLLNYRIHSGQERLFAKEYEQGAINVLLSCKESLSFKLNKKDSRLFNKYSLNFLLRTYADINKGFSDFLRFIKRCRQKGLIKYKDFRYIDARGMVSMISIILKNKKIVNLSRFVKDSLWKK